MQPVRTPTICLSMIVKNEAHILKRCLDSVIPYIDAWAILDTGSTDDTAYEVVKALGDLPGKLGSDAWVDFGTNRTHALELAQAQGCDYILVIDADEVLVVDDPQAFASLTHDAYRVQMHHADGLSWPRVNIMRSALSWRYVGIIHEHAEADPPVLEYQLAGVHMWTDGGGARGRDPEKAERDLAVMEQSVVLEPENARYWFYLAQGYEVARHIEQAIGAYAKRVAMGGNPDEVYYSYYRMAQLQAIQGQWQQAVHLYLTAYSVDPTRAEPLLWLAHGMIERGQDAVAMVFLEAIATLGKPVGAMFVEDAVYDYLRWIHYAATAHNLGRDDDARDIAGRLLASGKAPEKYGPMLLQLAHAPSVHGRPSSEGE